MHINVYLNHFCKTRISLSSIEEIALRSQLKICQASKRFEENKIYQEQKDFLIRQDVFLLIANNSMEVIKKKLAKLITLENFVFCPILHYLAKILLTSLVCQ